jgi:pyridinium-3,5-bisthiocarboxylic acid mononucleotide nickel chelatase
MRTAYIECFSGISGDMMLGAMVGAGAPFEHLQQVAAALNVGARLELRQVTRGGIAATKIDVIAPESHSHEKPHSHGSQPAHAHGHHHDEEHAGAAHRDSHTHAPHRSLPTILAIIRAAALADAVIERACRAFQLLGEAEAGIHSIPIEQVHFHEVGAVDTIVDIVCAAAGAEALKIDRWLSSSLNVGSGTVICQHGTLPVPAPATLALLGDAPVYAAGPPMERVTPTGAALLRMLDVRYATLPPMRVAAAGYGAGGRDTPGEPNLLRLLVGEGQPAEESSRETIAVIETVIDDSTPQVLAHASELLLAAGAWDVYRTTVQMKKGRTGVQMTVLCHPGKLGEMRELLFRETSTIGLRWRIENKVALARESVPVETALGPVRIKIARTSDGAECNASPEYEDCRAIAAQHSVPLKQVMQEAMRAYREKGDARAGSSAARAVTAKDVQG